LQGFTWRGLEALLSLLVLWSACSCFAAAPRFSDLPAVPPESDTNVSNEISLPSTNAPTNGAGSFTQRGTNAVTALDSRVATNAITALAAKAATNAVTAAGTNSMDALDDKHILAIGDKLSFRIVEDEEDPKPLFVTDSGDLEVPYIGRFMAVGKTCKQLARDLQMELQKEYYRHATVIVAVDLMTKSRGKVYVVGPVRSPGPQEIPSDEVLTLSKAILRAGGFSDFADKHKVQVTRKRATGEEQKFTVDVAAVMEKGRAESDLPLEAGDFIYVPERLIRF
jgi:protein involved in polysaccharide export with SLBB domain